MVLGISTTIGSIFDNMGALADTTDVRCCFLNHAPIIIRHLLPNHYPGARVCLTVGNDQPGRPSLDRSWATTRSSRGAKRDGRANVYGTSLRFQWPRPVYHVAGPPGCGTPSTARGLEAYQVARSAPIGTRLASSRAVPIAALDSGPVAAHRQGRGRLVDPGGVAAQE